MVTLRESKAKIKEYNKRMMELSLEYPDMSEYYKAINTLDDVFIPYQKYLDSLTQADISKYKIVSDINLDFNGVYIVKNSNEHYLGHYLIDILTLSKEVNYLHNYGVVDNATQVLVNCAIPDNAVVLLTAMFKDAQPAAFGWRWHKWGKYYGIQNRRQEYLADEPDIELVFCFSVVTVKGE